MATSRMRRVNEVMREVLGSAISTELQDPRIGFVTVTAVDTSPDLRHAVVHVSVLGSEAEREETLAGLEAAHGVLQSRINDELHMKRTPALSFAYDDSIERAARISRKLDELPVGDDEDDDGEAPDEGDRARPGGEPPR